MMAKLTLEKMVFYSYHGFFEEERKIGAEYEITLQVDVDIAQVGESDELSQTVNYQLLYNLVKVEMEIPSKLIEYVATRIMKSVIKNVPQVKNAHLWFTKKNPPLGGQVSGVTLEMVYPEE